MKERKMNKIFDSGGLRELNKNEKQCCSQTNYDEEIHGLSKTFVRCLKLDNHLGLHLWFDKDSVVIVWPELK